ncbi:MAG TPA: hypothetical protein VF057_10805 [Thermoanaerobaculia bacterium]
MTNQWSVTVNGRERQITIDQAETGKDVIRVDGRTVARPLTAAEQERVFAIDGYRYSLRREAGGFAVEQVPEPHSDLPHANPAVLTGNPDAFGIVPDRKFAALLRYWWVAVVIGVGVMIYIMVPRYEKDAAFRVETMLADLKDGADSESSLATTIWARNVRGMDSGELSAANNQFTKWRRERDFFYDKGFTSYKVVESKVVDGAEVPTAIVTFEIDGDQYSVVVPERRPIAWAE